MTTSHSITSPFELGLGFAAGAIGAALIEGRAAHAEAGAIRRQAAVLRARRVAAAVAAAQTRAEDDRLRDAILRRAIKAKAKCARG
ncbi:hypothetical protein [Methylobacterium komagatae]